MELPVRPSAMAELQAASAVGQGTLYRAYDEMLSARGIPTAQVLLTFFDMSARTHYLNARQTLHKLLDWRRVPVINENDTTTTDEITFGDNDFLAAQVAILLGADALLLLTDIDGLYTADPRHQSDAELIPEVKRFEDLESLEIGVSTSPLGSGGMRSKVVAAEMATAAGIPALILNGTRPAAIAAKPTRGRLQIDDGAEQALRERGTSLLPVGIVGVHGDFEAGDAVEVCPAGNGRPIGKGIVNYSADELRTIKGMKSSEIQALLPRAVDEAVHRDYFVLG
jgi:glutamate 5-kinase